MRDIRDFVVAPSLMCADMLNLEAGIQDIIDAGMDQIHFDIMDGCFVPNITLGFDLARQIKERFSVQTEAHLMTADVSTCVDLAIKSSFDMIAFHLEACKLPIRQLDKIRKAGIRAGVALDPSTPVDSLEYLDDYLDYVLIMTVEPGFSGQRFIPSVLTKIHKAREILGPDRPIIVDGNISVENAVKCIKQGADTLVAGTSAIFKKEGDLKENSTRFVERVRSYLGRG